MTESKVGMLLEKAIEAWRESATEGANVSVASRAVGR